MTFLLFIAALGAIVLIGLITNRLTGTKSRYLDALQLEAEEQELWRDAEADFAKRPHLGSALVRSYPRLRRHTIVWTNRRVIVAQKALWSSKRPITQELHFAHEAFPEAARAHSVAGQFAGGFYGRGFETIIAESKTFSEVNGKPCLRITPNADSAAALNIAELLIFSDRLPELQALLG